MKVKSQVMFTFLEIFIFYDKPVVSYLMNRTPNSTFKWMVAQSMLRFYLNNCISVYAKV